MLVKPKSWLPPKSKVRSRHRCSMYPSWRVYIFALQKRANCKQVQVQCSLECYARAGAVLQDARSPWICWQAARAAPLPFVQLVRDQNKQNPPVAAQGGLQRDSLMSQDDENALKKSTGRHWNAAHFASKSGPLTPRLFYLLLWECLRCAWSRIFYYVFTCMLTCRQGSAVNARVVY